MKGTPATIYPDQLMKCKVVGASSSKINPANPEQDAPATLECDDIMWEYFNPMSEIDIRSGGNLPHWEQGSVWYFVTFRLFDALPLAVIETIKRQREAWKQAHDLNRLSKDELVEYYRLFSERYESLLDAGNGSCLLRDPQNLEIVRRALRFFEGQRYALDEFVIMPNHVHVLVKPSGDHKLVDILHSWKSYTSNKINRRMQRSGQLWQHESYDHIVRNETARNAIRRYIREDPKVAGASNSRTHT